jgi:hypothetical protein
MASADKTCTNILDIFNSRYAAYSKITPLSGLSGLLRLFAKPSNGGATARNERFP